MTEELAIQSQTRSFREEVATWSEQKLRQTGEALGIPGAETLDKTTLREAIAQDLRDDLREDVRVQPEVRAARRSEQSRGSDSDR